MEFGFLNRQRWQKEDIYLFDQELRFREIK